MSFSEERFPTAVSYGVKANPRFNTSITKLRSGAEERVARWSYPLFAYEAKKGITSDDILKEVQEFVIARLGPFEGFRYKDHFNYSSDPDANMASSNPSFDDVQIGVGTGSQTQFQLVMKYTSGLITRTKNIYKPVTGTTVVGVDGVQQMSGWSVNTVTGIVLFSVAPANGAVITAGFEYDIPVRFGDDFDTEFFLSLDDFRSGSVPSITLLEEFLPGIVVDGFWHGGSSAITFGENISITPNDGRAISLTPSSSGLKVLLPETDELPDGADWFHLRNIGAHSISIVDDIEVPKFTLAANKSIIIDLILDSGSKVWYGAIGD